ncbi:MAG: lysophospholipid acyltransferase family protein [bacterium]
MNEKQEKFYRDFCRNFKPLLDFLVKLQAKGLRHIPESGGCILVCNHKSDMDPVILSFAIERPITWMAGAYLYNIPLIGDFLKNVGSVPISPKKEVVEEAMRLSMETLEKGQMIGIFPEGWDYIADGQFNKPLGKFHTGFARMALASGALVIPSAIIPVTAFADTMPIPSWARKLWKFPGKMADVIHHFVYKEAIIQVGRPVQVSGDIDRENLHSISENIRGKVDQLIRRHEVYNLMDEGLL